MSEERVTKITVHVTQTETINAIDIDSFLSKKLQSAGIPYYRGTIAHGILTVGRDIYTYDTMYIWSPS